MLKMTKLQESNSDVFIKLEGKITDQWVGLLDDECRLYLEQGKAVHLDCSHVDFIDVRGVDALTSAPSFVTELLESGGRS